VSAPHGWIAMQIGDLCSLVNGRAFKPSEWANEGLPIIRIQNLNDRSKPFNHFAGHFDPKHLVSRGDVLLSWSGTPGTSFGCFVWDRDSGVLNQHIFKVNVNCELCSPEFFMYAVNNALDEMIEKAHGAVGLRHITKSRLEQIELPIAPLCEQGRIVDKVRECLARVQEIDSAQTSLRVEAQHLIGSFFNETEASSDWPKANLAELILESRNGRSIRSSADEGNGRVLTLSSVRNVHLDLTAVKTVSFDDRTASTYQIQKEDVFVSRSNTIDLVGLASVAQMSPDGRLIYPDLLMRLKPNPKKVRSEFLANVLRFPSCRKQIQFFAKGTSQSMVKISGSELKQLKLPCPNLDQQDLFLDHLAEINTAQEDLLCQVEQAIPRTMRKSILRQAFAGEL
jgi:type I restriction enzyme, S subunit